METVVPIKLREGIEISSKVRARQIIIYVLSLTRVASQRVVAALTHAPPPPAPSSLPSCQQAPN